MSVRVDPSFLEELRRFGAADVTACFNCGNCTAVCPLAGEEGSFPRRLIRYAQLGLRQRLAASRELWLCYGCGDCSETCPRQADPTGFLASARRYFISAWDLTTIAPRLYTSPIFTACLIGVLTVVLTGMFLGSGGRSNPQRLDLFGFVDLQWIHYTGIAVLALAGLAMVANIANFVRASLLAIRPGPQGPRPLLQAAWGAIGDTLKELALQRNFGKCESPIKSAQGHWYLNMRFLHLAIMWGFLGLWGATALDFLFKTPGSFVPLWYPARLLGSVSGLLVLYGTSVAILFRLTKKGGRLFASTLLSDWLLLGLLWTVTASGFAVEIAVYQAEGPAWGYVAFLLHVVTAMELLILMPFTKFAHALYRPLGIWAFHLKARRQG
jgi:ferredoxin